MTRDPHLAATRIVQDAGGKLVGRTRLQKVTYLMQLAGFGDEFVFEYRHYGPFSEDLANGMEIARAFGYIKEEEHTAEWGGRYSIYSSSEPSKYHDERRSIFVIAAKAINAIELELAATAAFLFTVEKCFCPWEETSRRKPDKIGDGRLKRAIAEYEMLRKLSAPKQLPALPCCTEISSMLTNSL